MFELILQSRHKIDRYFGKIKCYYFLRTFIFVCCIIWIFFYTVFRCKSYINDLSTIIETKPCGAVQGITEENIFIFKGIPYAQPPIKNLRWQRPLELCHEDGSCWKGIYKADHFPNSCFQSRMPSSEDCLYLNIWTPILSRTEKLAVVVFLHGGCLLNGNGNMGLGYMPTSSFIAKSNIVFVSLNYRLNAFGYMALDVLSKRSQNSKSGNYGFWDQVQALKWVKDNIINFGGDPEKITIFGHSSGGTSLFTLLSSPYARGLFHRVWISSGSPLINVTLNEASKYNLPFLKNADCENADCLLRMPPNEVYNAIPMYEYPYWDPMDMIDLPTKGVITASLPIVDGDFLPYPPVEVWSRKEGIDVPIIIGNTAQEVDFYLNKAVKTWTWTDYKNNLKKHLDSFSPQLYEEALHLYPAYQNTVELQHTTLITDLRVTCPTSQVALKASENFHSPIYRYIVTSFPSKRVHFLGLHIDGSYALHAWDAIAFFGAVADVIDKPSKEDYQFQEIIQDTFLHFIKTGQIKHSEWLPYPHSTALFSHKLNVVDKYHEKECNLWLRKEFEPYAWQN